MKYAVIADIHGNLEAFEVVLADAREQKCTHYCCVGDVVGLREPRTSTSSIFGGGLPSALGGGGSEVASGRRVRAASGGANATPMRMRARTGVPALRAGAKR